MNARRCTLTLTCLLFGAFLLSPGFVSSVHGDGTRRFMNGIVSVQLSLFLPVIVSQLKSMEFEVIPITLANLAFFALPALHFSGLAQRPRLNQALRWLFFCGGCGFLKHLWGVSYQPAFPAYLWPMAAMAAMEYLAVSMNPSPRTTHPKP